MDYDKELEQVAKPYLNEGYAIAIRPPKEELPAFAKEFGVDILATRGGERVLVQVKQDRAALEADPEIPLQAGITNAQPGWRYDVVILNEDDPLRRMMRGAREPSEKEIDEILSYAEKLVHTGDLRAACVFAWSALEAAMRRVANGLGLYLPRRSPSELLRTLYGNGIVSREDFDLLNSSYRLRTEVVHGLVSAAIDPALIEAAVRVARTLMAGPLGIRNVAG